MKKISVITLCLLANLLAIPAAEGATVTPQSLAKKVAKTGKGCDGPLEVKNELLGGKSADCTYNGEPLTLTVYGAKFYKAAIKVGCALDIGVITVTDGKTWIATPSSRSAAKALAKPLGGKVKVLCNSKNIINETYQPELYSQDSEGSQSAQAPTSTPTPAAPKVGSLQLPYKLNDTANVGNFTVTVMSVDERSSQQVCIATGGYGDICGNDYTKDTDQQRYFVKPGITKKYVLFEITFTNQGKSASAPGNELSFKFTDQNGLLMNESYIGDLNATSTSLIPGGVLKTKIGFVLDQAVDTTNLKLSIAPFFSEPTYFGTR